MALFGKKTQKKDVPEKPLVVAKTLIQRARITEKATLASDKSVYTYEVARNATKHSVRNEIIKKYGKTPLKVNISTLPSKMRKKGKKPEVKKAYVYLKKGDTIDFIS
jgi:ribosomal protein L23